MGTQATWAGTQASCPAGTASRDLSPTSVSVKRMESTDLITSNCTDRVDLVTVKGVQAGGHVCAPSLPVGLG